MRNHGAEHRRVGANLVSACLHLGNGRESFVRGSGAGEIMFNACERPSILCKTLTTARPQLVFAAINEVFE
jgi:hypothetical protein